MNAEQIEALGLELPPPPKPGGVYQPLLIHDGLAYVSGHGPLLPDETYLTGKVGGELGVDEGRPAARQTGLAILATLQARLGSLNRVKRLGEIFRMVNATADFGEHPQVINGYSELMAEVFGPENGVGTRSAIGMESLPGNIAVEIEAVFEVAD